MVCYRMLRMQRRSGNRPLYREFTDEPPDLRLDSTAEQSGTAVATHLDRCAAFSTRMSGLWSVAGQFRPAELNGEERMTQTSKTKTRPKTKKALLEQMLRRKTGADVGAISRKMGWQPHTTRAALSGLRKKGFNVTRDEASGNQPARYRIVAEPKSAKVRSPEETASADAR